MSETALLERAEQIDEPAPERLWQPSRRDELVRRDPAFDRQRGCETMGGAVAQPSISNRSVGRELSTAAAASSVDARASCAVVSDGLRRTAVGSSARAKD